MPDIADSIAAVVHGSHLDVVPVEAMHELVATFPLLCLLEIESKLLFIGGFRLPGSGGQNGYLALSLEVLRWAS